MFNRPELAPSDKKGLTPALLRTEGLGKTFNIPQGWRRKPLMLEAVDDVNLSLSQGQTLGIVGESGCGKSTLSRLLVGTLLPSKGSIHIGGVDITTQQDEPQRRVLRDIQMVFQSPYMSLNPRMNIGKIVREPLDIHDSSLSIQERAKRMINMLELVGLNADHAKRFPHQLSGGQQQRVGIARALIRRPRIVICDEPVSALDVSIQAQVINLLLKLQADFGVSYIFVSHDLAVVASIAHDIAVMYLGRIVEHGSAHDVLMNPKHPYTQALIDSANVPDPGIEKARRRTLLIGDLPNPADPPSGCRFRTRCRLAVAQCALVVPVLESRRGSPQSVACHLA